VILPLGAGVMAVDVAAAFGAGVAGFVGAIGLVGIC